MEALHPGLQIKGVNLKPRARKPALLNIEKALSILWQKGVKARYIPTSEEVLSGSSDKINYLVKV